MRFKTARNVFSRIYQNVIVNERKEVNFWILIFFILTFAAARLIVYFLPGVYLSVKEIHIHHFSYGIFILAIVGFLALNDVHHRKRRVYGSLYGVGLALAMDEFGIWISLNDNYWVRHSYDAALLTIAILALFVYFDNFWRLIFDTFFKRYQEETKKYN